MNSLLANLRKHSPAVLAFLGVVYAALVQQGFVSTNNRLVTLIVAVLSASGITVLHVRQQST